MLDINPIVVSFGLVVLFGYMLQRNRHIKHDPLEPPLISGPIPVIGHLAAFIYYGLEYFPLQR